MTDSLTNQPAENSHPAFRCLSLDLEVSVQDHHIHKFAAVRQDTGQTVVYPDDGGDSLNVALAKLDELADGADFLLGHNLIDFDLPHMKAVDPDLQLLRWPAVDTLMLNPLAFPRNPYHHLVKHYKNGQLRRDRINDPELDARLTLKVFDNQQRALKNAPPSLLAAWHWLTASNGGTGFDKVFASLRQSRKPTDTEAQDVIRTLLAGRTCRTHALEAMAEAIKHGWALAYTLAWLSVSGSNSVMPPWVRHQFPKAERLVRRLRDTACTNPDCEWCRDRHDPRKELTRWFGFPGFRPEPKDDAGRPMQQSIVEAAMAGEHLLAILPTGTGKSLCYQIPALSRYDKTGALTVVISPLVALMTDQVTGLKEKGIDSCVTINGLLSMPERAAALDQVRLGDAGILIISPEQLRSVSVRRSLEQREIGAWVLDEAHCLSKWGHDFRPDYRYVGRFIRERAGEQQVPSILCLTATAKPDVKDDIENYFQKELGIQLRVFDGGAQRTNLEFFVEKTSGAEKSARVHQILSTDLPEDEAGGAIVYCATRRNTEELADFLQAKEMKANYFHAGLPSETKKEIQQRFIRGQLRVITATNAFGMGIDKPDVRLVIHADIPGSLENYLQEAGRAGRDQKSAHCVLLYIPDDVDRQFGMSARSRLTRREIRGILRALRKLDRKKRLEGMLEATSGEILGEDDDKAFERDSVTDDTRARIALAWLEEAGLLTQEENRVQVFPSSLLVSSLKEVHAKLNKTQICDDHRRRLMRIAEMLIETGADEGITTDDMTATSGLTSEEVREALYDLERYGIASNDMVLTTFVHTGVQRSSRNRFEQAAALEQALITLLREMAPDMDLDDKWPLHLRHVSQRLKDDGFTYALPERLRSIVHSIAMDGTSEGGGKGSLGVRGQDRETVLVTLQRKWKNLAKTAEIRRAGAQILLNHLLDSLPKGSRGTDLLAETTLGKLLTAVQSDLVLKSEITKPDKLVDRALLWLHEQDIIRLNKGMTVFRQAMTIRLKQGSRDFVQADFAPLQLHYDEQVLQIHVMKEYAQQGLDSMDDAQRLAMDYFNMSQEEFLHRWLPDRDREIKRQTTPESWQAIVESLKNPNQRRIVADDRVQTNVLVLAGPGSGKTRVLVHRIAYLIRVRREKPSGILALAYNRHAAVEIRRRLAELVGDDARGVTVFTCHALAMRLVGASFEGRANRLNDSVFKELLQQAISLLRGDELPPDEADEDRARLLAGFRWILVDEYQDIGPDQYDLISALAGRTLSEEDDKLSLFAVGDDDQNIYAFSGASVEFIRRFEEDYRAKPEFLTDNYRSNVNIIAAANAVIEPARQRMKREHPIHVDPARAKEPAGGVWAELDPVARGRVQIIPAGETSITQAQAVISELKRLSTLSPDWNWSACAVVAREWKYLDPVRSLCEIEGIPVQMANEEFSGIWYLRETRALVDWLRGRDSQLVTSGELRGWLIKQPEGPWNELLQEGIAEYELENSGAETPVVHFIEWLAEWGREVRRSQRGLLLLTAHRAKGLEFDHVVVLDGGWDSIGRGEDADASRRLYYVAMTRARQTLTLSRISEVHPFQDTLLELPSVLQRQEHVSFPPAALELSWRYVRLSLRHVNLGFAGNEYSSHPVHRAITALSPGDPLKVRKGAKSWELLDRNETVVGRLAGSYEAPVGMRCVFATVYSIVNWDRERSDLNHQRRVRCDRWEVVVPELVFEPESQTRWR
ncbi:MAG: RecQ family ATP-dependent DNA helicase [Caldilineaceae bacterium SB0668_bin_21]|nr:RecQ family ATP-dependent DNA helicase [Caldilineaceae bacterium SB0668_bin_21]MYC22536.1 RecQ family ATP-dependent DNA helicase [Caldilineaceae bacterium SB0662_bin_25]